MKRNYRIFAAVLLSATVLTACGSKNDAATVDNEPAQDESVAEEYAEPDFSDLETKTLLDVDVDGLVELGQYKEITIEAPKEEVTEDDVDYALENTYFANPLMRDVTDRPIEIGDTANIDFVGKYADTLEEFEGGAGEGFDLEIGSGSFIDGFEDGLVGVSAGETVDLDLTFPEDYGATELAGKAVVFTVTVNSVKVADAEPSDEWAAGLGIDGVSTLEEYRANLKEELESDAEEEFRYNAMNSAIDIVVDNSTVKEVPEELVNRYYIYVYDSVQGYLQQMIMYGIGTDMTVEDYVRGIMDENGITGEPEDYMRDVATQQASRLMVLQAIANAEGIVISEDEIDEFMQDYFNMYYSNSYESYDDFKAQVDTEDYREQIMTEKIAGFIVDNANVVEVEATEDEETSEEDADALLD